MLSWDDYNQDEGNPIQPAAEPVASATAARMDEIVAFDDDELTVTEVEQVTAELPLPTPEVTQAPLAAPGDGTAGGGPGREACRDARRCCRAHGRNEHRAGHR